MAEVIPPPPNYTPSVPTYVPAQSDSRKEETTHVSPRVYAPHYVEDHLADQTHLSKTAKMWLWGTAILILIILLLVWWYTRFSKPNCNKYTGDAKKACDALSMLCANNKRCLHSVKQCMPSFQSHDFSKVSDVKNMQKCSRSLAQLNPEWLSKNYKAFSDLQR